MNNSRIYLDNAATTWPKPEIVYKSVEEYLRNIGVASGRGNYSQADEVQRKIGLCRSKLADFIGASNPDQVVFTANGSDSLNIAIHGLLNQGDHVVTTKTEHNSVLRPINELSKNGTIEFTLVDCDSDGLIDVESVERSIKPKTSLLILNHVSNVTGTKQPLDEVGEVAKRHEIPVLVDAAQSLGAIPIDVSASNISALAAPGHKGLFGILGSGFLFVEESLNEKLRTTKQGGTGTQSENMFQPFSMPQKLETGNLNVPAILSMLAGLEFLDSTGVESISKHVHKLSTQLFDGLSRIEDIELFGPKNRDLASGIVCFGHPEIDPREFANMLDSGFGIQVRAGLHCAPLIHENLRTGTGGAVRMSPGYFTTEREIEITINAVQEIANSMSNF